MKFLDKMIQLAKTDKKKIVLPESTDIRTLQATAEILKQGIADVILLGVEEEILKLGEGLNLQEATIIDYLHSADFKDYAESLYELRKHKGVTLEQAEEMMKDSLYYAVMMVKKEAADGMVAGAIHATADTLRPALQILKTAPQTKLVSSFFVMEVPDCELGNNGVFVMGDCALMEKPDAQQLSEIALASAKSFRTFVGAEPKVAMLSYSTKGSAQSESVDVVVEATKLAKEKNPQLEIDGELQLDAAIVPSVGKSKAPGSTVAGAANTLIFPDLNSGNIGYKLVQRLAKAEAYGPVLQGIAKPVNDLSRGASYEDIVGVVAITCVQAQNL